MSTLKTIILFRESFFFFNRGENNSSYWQLILASYDIRSSLLLELWAWGLSKES